MTNMDLSHIKVLIVDDIELNLKIAEKIMSSYKCSIRTARGGKEALESIAQEQPDLVLLDLLMPDIDGFEVLRRIRAGEAGDPNTVVIILSSLGTKQDILRGYELGANDYITKPIIIQRLYNVVETQLKAKANN